MGPTEQEGASLLSCSEPELLTSLGPSLMEQSIPGPQAAAATFQHLISGGSLWCPRLPWLQHCEGHEGSSVLQEASHS